GVVPERRDTCPWPIPVARPPLSTLGACRLPSGHPDAFSRLRPGCGPGSRRPWIGQVPCAAALPVRTAAAGFGRPFPEPQAPSEPAARQPRLFEFLREGWPL